MTRMHTAADLSIGDIFYGIDAGTGSGIDGAPAPIAVEITDIQPPNVPLEQVGTPEELKWELTIVAVSESGMEYVFGMLPTDTVRVLRKGSEPPVSPAPDSEDDDAPGAE